MPSRRPYKSAGGVDVVVNNAGYGLSGAAEEVSDAEIRHQMETNFFGLVAVTQAALPFMRAQKRGHIVNISSVAGYKGILGMSIYSASKFAVEGFSEGLAAEAGHLGIQGHHRRTRCLSHALGIERAPSCARPESSRTMRRPPAWSARGWRRCTGIRKMIRPRAR